MRGDKESATSARISIAVAFLVTALAGFGCSKSEHDADFLVDRASNDEDDDGRR